MPSKVKDIMERDVKQHSGIITTFRAGLFFSAVFMLLFISSQASEKKQLDLAGLHGDWKGTGTFLMPVTDFEVDIEGQANFRYDSSTGRLRTALSGEKFLFTYSDSGYVTPDAKGDSLTWEVWDNFGRHAKYRGALEDNTIKGKRRWKGKNYSVEITQSHADSILFRMTVQVDDEPAIEKAIFKLWRVK